MGWMHIMSYKPIWYCNKDINPNKWYDGMKPHHMKGYISKDSNVCFETFHFLFVRGITCCSPLKLYKFYIITDKIWNVWLALITHQILEVISMWSSVKYFWKILMTIFKNE